ncbi:hypothetical protein MTR_3g109000 [Medicago truncatula]|uniref:Uncharacterized protein n=1 Tax=Medicago truncatula TaxID=3880 RepID=G7J2T3_MEDTR|nr:hypothetical protein MTR_3g109000 [Medicago truncatula]
MELVVLMLIDLSPNNLHQLNVIVNHVPIASDKAFKHKDKNLNDQVEDTTVNAPLFVKTHLQRSIFLEHDRAKRLVLFVGYSLTLIEDVDELGDSLRQFWKATPWIEIVTRAPRQYKQVATADVLSAATENSQIQVGWQPPLGMLESLELARQYGFRKVELSVDSKSKVVVQTLCRIWKVKVLVHKNYSAKEIEGNVRGTKESILNS